MNLPHHKPPHLDVSKTNLDYNEFADEYAQAKYALGLLEGSQKKLQNPTLLISPLTAKEAAVSSKIEGTVSTVSDVFIYEAGGKHKDPDAAQVANYKTAMHHAIGELEQGRGITNHLIKSLHATLLEKVRHKGTLGQFREDTVYIAERPSDPLEKSIYIPPEFIQVQGYMDNIMEYLDHSSDGALIKAGMFHYQFEAVHPFMDGNGRLGRLLIPLILFQEQKLSLPILYLSGYFEAHREHYRSALHEVDETGKYENWMKFFLNSVGQQLHETQNLVEAIYQLYDEIKNNFQFTKSPYLIPFLDFIFASPAFTISMIQESLTGCSRQTATRLIDLLMGQEIVKELDFRVGRIKIFSFPRLLNLIS